MADSIISIPDVIRLTAKVAKSFVEYGRQVKDAPRLIMNIHLEVNALKTTLETLYMTLGDNGASTQKTGLSDSLSQCRGLLNELQLLVSPEVETESDDEELPNRKTPRKKQVSFHRFGHGRATPTPSRHQHNDNSDVDHLQSLMQAQISSEHHLAQNEPHNFNMNPNVPGTPTRSPRRRPIIDLSTRFKWPLFQKGKAEELLKQLERQKTQLGLAVQTDNAINLHSIAHSIKDIEANLNDNEKRAVLAWLCPRIDMYEFHREQHDKQEDETCEWITTSRGWKQWLNGGSYEPNGYRRFIWIYGIPGAGKTVLASFLIDSIAVHCRATGYSYYYCHNERNQDETINFLRWIVGDLSRQIDRFIPQELDKLSQSQGFTIEGLMNCFAALSRKFKSEGRRVYLIVDAVDESKKPRKRLLDVLIAMGTDITYENVSILMTSREEEDIGDAMAQAATRSQLQLPSTARDSDVLNSAFMPYTSITMSNSDVMRAIQKYVEKQFERNAKFRMWSPDFRAQIEKKLARNARGMFRWVACQIDILERIYMDADKVSKALDDLPETLFDTYERILQSIRPEQHAFARTALALICSNTFKAKSADVLVQASLHNVLHGAMHMYTIETLKEILGCLIKVTNLRKRYPTKFRREDDNIPLQKVAVAHYTVREFLFAKSKKDGEPRPAGEFALSDMSIRVLETQVVFNGLLQWGRNRPQNSRAPTRYEEYCLEMSEWAMRGARQNLLIKNHGVWESVVQCLIPGRPHTKAITNVNLRRHFPRWAKLSALDEPSPGQQPQAAPNRGFRQETGILASLVLLNWPEFAQKYLKDPNFQILSPEAKHAVWTNKFSINPPDNTDIPRTFEKGEPVTLLQMCVSWKRPEFLELFIDAGANFTHEPDIIFTALEHPYGLGELESDGSVTSQLLKMLLEAGADPNPPGYLYTPLQFAVHHLEESWVQSLLIEARDANLIGDPNGEHPYGLKKHEDWHRLHPLEICRRTPPGRDNDGSEGLNSKAKKRIEQLLIQYGAECEPDVIDVSDSPDRDGPS
ncbi:hypothetical protein F5Y00DRAFT_259284 [Daldinia vernicosa]|uniref:uncharacterized protein n=1 Tax=Daldinia vernicosa TaxID=114800 RepID=UPI0020078B09|nr:uncharacterized protein F5Y00DRAFT_259284 [Daldinia vernicosa]KAI0851795.1 hypothetical protein F5Y00DRAFT_259284 [Daldinia vernicosa]